MGHIPPVARDTASDEQRRVGDIIFTDRGETYAGPSSILLHAPEIAERFDDLREVLVRKSEVPRNLLQLSTLVAVRFFTAQYAWGVRERLARQAGVAQGVIDAIRERRRPVFDKPNEEAIYDYATELFENRRVTDATHARALAVLGQEQLVTLVATIGLYSMLSVVCNAFEPPFREPGPPPLAD